MHEGRRALEDHGIGNLNIPGITVRDDACSTGDGRRRAYEKA